MTSLCSLRHRWQGGRRQSDEPVFGTDAALIDEINALLEVKMRAGESAASPRWHGIHNFIEQELAIAMAHNVAKVSKTDVRQLDCYLHDAVLHFGHHLASPTGMARVT